MLVAEGSKATISECAAAICLSKASIFRCAASQFGPSGRIECCAFFRSVLCSLFRETKSCNYSMRAATRLRVSTVSWAETRSSCALRTIAAYSRRAYAERSEDA